MRPLFVVSLVAVLPAGCDPEAPAFSAKPHTAAPVAAPGPVRTAAPVPERVMPKEPPLYFPTKVGTKSVYLSNGSDFKSHTSVQIVTAVENGKDGAKIVTVSSVHPDGHAYPTARYEASSRGLAQVWLPKLDGAPAPHRLLQLPYEDGLRLPYPGGINVSTHRPEKVKVPAGEFECLRVEYHRSSKDQKLLNTYWYAPGVGEVKFEQGDYVRVLKSFTPGKD